ncbi:MAG: preprotein translocase subunit YajC [Candidatus Omnitrophica bacterium]|nr:preprotein translocase subunit YajC [Candidatus Omnitrophota bacterium]
MIPIPLLLAQQTQPSGAQPDPFLALLPPMLIMIGVFYFLIFRPQHKRQKELDQLVNNLKKGDKVITSGGIVGTVLAPPGKDGIVVLKTGQETKIEVLKSAISQKQE